MTSEEFNNQSDIHFHEMQRDLMAKHAGHFVWAMRVYDEMKPYLEFLDFFVEMEWNEIDDKG